MYRTPRLLRLAATAGATALVATSLFLAPAAASAATVTDDSTSTSCDLGDRLLGIWGKLPENLQADLQALRDLPPGERGDAARDIRQGARDGEYGDAVQDHALRVRDRRAWIWITMNDDLKAELKVIHDADPADRPALVQQLADDALAGVYGDRAQTIAQRIQEHCAG